MKVNESSSKSEDECSFMYTQCTYRIQAKGVLVHHRLARQYGYEVNIHYVELERNIALGRMLNRFLEDGRFLDPGLMDKYAPRDNKNLIEKSYEELKMGSSRGGIDGYSGWDNNVGRGEKPILIEFSKLSGNYIDNERMEGENVNERN